METKAITIRVNAEVAQIFEKASEESGAIATFQGTTDVKRVVPEVSYRPITPPYRSEHR